MGTDRSSPRQDSGFHALDIMTRLLECSDFKEYLKRRPFSKIEKDQRIKGEERRQGHLERSAGFEEEDSNLTEVEVDEVLGLVGDVGTEVSSHNAMPGWVVLLVELLLDEGGDILLDVELLEGLGGDIDSILLHVFGHISVLDDSLSISHGEI